MLRPELRLRRLAPREFQTKAQPGLLVPVRDFSVRSVFARAKRLEQNYAVQLRSVARVIEHFVRGHVRSEEDLSETAIAELEAALRAYARTLTPWARSVGERMITEVAARDERSWFKVAAQMGRDLRREIEQAPTGHVMQARLADQVKLITSLPEESAQRVRELATEARIQGTRAGTLAAKIMETGEVSKARANTIARTEVSRTAVELTRARAEYCGSTHFVWNTAHDDGVRPSHKRLDGQVFRWDTPPECDPGHHALPGAIWNCRCVATPLLDELEVAAAVKKTRH